MSEIKEQIIESKPLREQVADIVRGMILRGAIQKPESKSVNVPLDKCFMSVLPL
ncbi:MAG: hypothetical protein ACLVD8_27240 [Enterocloster sp.]|uniref:hypothetical protein n=1 Tax=Enterocloster sp. TaxID=2719315 RepID=UPI00399A5F6E